METSVENIIVEFRAQRVKVLKDKPGLNRKNV